MSFIGMAIDQYTHEVVKRQLRAIPGAIERASLSSVNDTAKQGKAKSAREIARASGLKLKNVKNRIRFYRATRSDARARVEISGWPVSLMAWKPRQNRKGVWYRKGKEKVEIAGAFIVPNPKVNPPRKKIVGAFQRTTQKRLPIQKLVGPSLAAYFRGADEVRRAVVSDMKSNLRKNFLRRAKLEILRYTGRVSVPSYMRPTAAQGVA